MRVSTPTWDRLSDVQRTSMLVHGAGHLAAMVGQVAREDAKTVMESSVFVVLAHGGISAMSYSFPYVTRWAEDKVVLRHNQAEAQGVATRGSKSLDSRDSRYQSLPGSEER